ncbi:MAG: UvrD-helicase domain-containing protein [Chitinophagales bacterium]|nr:exodeoxyribonuclease V subunit gamma [Bacteroidota bacterium]MCB9043333.1 exodeoxyribonuclease V subunit gamma [Chitinophagales bacterium]
MSFLQELNETQRAAVQHTEGPVMIIAGPGSGKTRVLTYRIAWLIHQGIDPFNILALTFTNKAAREMRHRIESLCNTQAYNIWMGTFHAIFAKILRVEAPRLGYPSNFSIYDTQDSRSLLKTIIKEQNLNPDIYKPNGIHARISMAKNNLILPDVYAQNTELIAEDEAAKRPKFALLYRLYCERCFKAGAMDFDDLLLKMYEVLEKFPEVLEKYQSKFRYILVDEFQDTNRLQYEIVKKLAVRHQNICVVGDDAQSIYAFRGATIENILFFEKDYPEREVYKLEQNYRSTQKIVSIANDIIANNKNQLPKKIWTDNDDGTHIKLFSLSSDNEEGKKIADAILENTLRHHYMYHDFAILYRTNAQSRAFEDALRRANIPYVVYGGLSFYQRKEIKDMMAYLKLSTNHFDEEALRRIINYPTRGIGDTSLNRMTIFAQDNDLRLWEALELVENSGLSTRAQNAISEFVIMIKSFTAMLEKKNAYEVAEHIGRTTGIFKELYNDKSIEGISRFENFQELLNAIKDFSEEDNEELVATETQDKSLGAYLQQVSLLTDQDSKQENPETVKLMTIHAAKGLEFKNVFVVGMEEELFPSRMSLSSRDELEEERRLFYVAATRAEENLYLSYAKTRYRFGNLQYCEPSRFLKEIPMKFIETNFIQTEKSSAKPDFSQRILAAPRAASNSKVNFTPPDNFRIDDTSQLNAGQKVMHQRFGIGIVEKVEGVGNNKIASIDFEGTGIKRIMLRFAKLMIV